MKVLEFFFPKKEVLVVDDILEEAYQKLARKEEGGLNAVFWSRLGAKGFNWLLSRLEKEDSHETIGLASAMIGSIRSFPVDCLLDTLSRNIPTDLRLGLTLALPYLNVPESSFGRVMGYLEASSTNPDLGVRLAAYEAASCLPVSTASDFLASARQKELDQGAIKQIERLEQELKAIPLENESVSEEEFATLQTQEDEYLGLLDMAKGEDLEASQGYLSTPLQAMVPHFVSCLHRSKDLLARMRTGPTLPTLTKEELSTILKLESEIAAGLYWWFHNIGKADVALKYKVGMLDTVTLHNLSGLSNEDEVGH